MTGQETEDYRTYTGDQLSHIAFPMGGMESRHDMPGRDRVSVPCLGPKQA